jgi:hypothetical protein
VSDVPVHAVVVSLAISGLACIAWGLVLARIGGAIIVRAERRRVMLVMPMVGLLAAIGTFASALGIALSTGLLDLGIARETLNLVASMGRGALLMGGIIAALFYRPNGGRQ